MPPAETPTASTAAPTATAPQGNQTSTVSQNPNSPNLEVRNSKLQDNPQSLENDQRLTLLAREIGECLAEEQSSVLKNASKNYAAAIECYEKNLEYARSARDRAREGYALHNLGVTAFAMGNYSKSIEYHQQRFAVAASLGDALGEAAALNGLGDAYGAVGNYEKAVEFYQKSLEIARSMKSAALEGSVLNNLGLVYYSQKNYPLAVEAQEQSLAIARQQNNRRRERMALGALGLAYYGLTDYNKAIEYQQQSLGVARELQDRLGEGRVLENLGLAYYALKDYTKAVEYQKQSLAIAKELGDLHAEGRALTNLGDALYQAKQPDEAIQTLLAAIEVWESLRENLDSSDLNKVSIFETQETTYSTLQEYLVKENRVETALEINERGRSRAFVELLAKSIASRSIEADIAPPNLSQIQQIAREQNTTLVSYAIVKRVVETGGTRALEDSEIYIWVIQPTGKITFRRSDLKALNAEKITLTSLVSNARCFNPACLARKRSRQGAAVRGGEIPDDRFLDIKLQELHKLLIEPIADLLPENPEAHVTFIPHQELFLVPFPALQDSQGKYLIEKHAILTAPSIQVLDLTQKKRQSVSGKDALVVGNPTMPSIAFTVGEPPHQLDPLPNAEAEAREIASILKTTALTGAAATKETVVKLLQQARIVHLATHGLLDDFAGIGMPGAIALAPTATDSGLLTSSEIINLKLNAELVVLSACDTGRGRITGDGVIGLSRSFISAGVPSLVVSLWPVPDKSTADLMKEFYRQLQQNPDKALALRSAMLSNLKQYKNPLDWAAFTLIGEP